MQSEYFNLTDQVINSMKKQSIVLVNNDLPDLFQRI